MMMMGEKKKDKKQKQQYHRQDVPEIIIYNILLRIPPDLLLSKFRSVCRCWLDIISSPLFVEQLPNHSNPSLILQFPTRKYGKTHLLRMKELKEEFEILSNNGNTHLCPMGRIRASCNGLLLTHDPIYPKVIIVFNPVTKGRIHTLPPNCLSDCKHTSCSFSLAFDSSKNQYKVVHMYADQFGFEILNLGTTGSDDDDSDGKYSWRKVQGGPFDVDEFSWSDATLVDSKFLHWKVDSKEYIISMDVSDERSRKTFLPRNGTEACNNLDRLDYVLVEMGGYLAIMFGVHRDDGNSTAVDQLDFWILKDFEEGIWMKKLSIVMECINFVSCKPQLDMLRPRGCLEDGRVIVFERISIGSSSSSSGLYVYDVRSSSMKKFWMKIKSGGCKIVAHKSSFSSWVKEWRWTRRLIDAGVCHDLLVRI